MEGLNKSNIWDYENAFYWFSHPARLNKMLAHYELYKKILGLPGEVFELGVYKAASLVRLATYRNLLENDYSRKIVGFDAFGKFPIDGLSLKGDLDFIDRFEIDGGDGLPKATVEEIFESKKFQNVALIEGNVLQTLPAYLERYPATRLALLHLDMDVKEPTAYALDILYDRVVPNGLIILDDYGSVTGETDAVDEFLSKNQLNIEKISYNHAPSYIHKRIK